MEAKDRILVVDDEYTFRTLLSTELEEEGYRVFSAGDGDEAIGILRTRSFDLVLLDNKMPNVDGDEVLKYVKANYPGTKVIMLTGSSDLQDAVGYKVLGADHLISKPFDLAGLLVTIKCILSSD